MPDLSMRLNGPSAQKLCDNVIPRREPRNLEIISVEY
jgi:hypothetical protein